MVNTRQIPSLLKLVLCALLCIGATLDDLDYINAIRAPRTMNGLRASVADEDSDDQHAHLILAPVSEAVDLITPFLSALYATRPPKALAALRVCPIVRSGRAPPPCTA